MIVAEKSILMFCINVLISVNKVDEADEPSIDTTGDNHALE